jgi:hypothetical protein
MECRSPLNIRWPPRHRSQEREQRGGVSRSFAGKLTAHLFAALLHPAVEDFAVRPGEVDVLEDAASLLDSACKAATGDAVAGDHDELAGLHIALKFSAQQVEGA